MISIYLCGSAPCYSHAGPALSSTPAAVGIVQFVPVSGDWYDVVPTAPSALEFFQSGTDSPSAIPLLIAGAGVLAAGMASFLYVQHRYPLRLPDGPRRH